MIDATAVGDGYRDMLALLRAINANGGKVSADAQLIARNADASALVLALMGMCDELLVQLARNATGSEDEAAAREYNDQALAQMQASVIAAG